MVSLAEKESHVTRMLAIADRMDANSKEMQSLGFPDIALMEKTTAERIRCRLNHVQPVSKTVVANQRIERRKQILEALRWEPLTVLGVIEKLGVVAQFKNLYHYVQPNETHPIMYCWGHAYSVRRQYPYGMIYSDLQTLAKQGKVVIAKLDDNTNIFFLQK